MHLLDRLYFGGSPEARIVDWSWFINGNRINRISDSERSISEFHLLNLGLLIDLLKEKKIHAFADNIVMVNWT